MPTHSELYVPSPVENHIAQQQINHFQSLVDKVMLDRELELRTVDHQGPYTPSLKLRVDSLEKFLESINSNNQIPDDIREKAALDMLKKSGAIPIVKLLLPKLPALAVLEEIVLSDGKYNIKSPSHRARTEYGYDGKKLAVDQVRPGDYDVSDDVHRKQLVDLFTEKLQASSNVGQPGKYVGLIAQVRDIADKHNDNMTIDTSALHPYLYSSYQQWTERNNINRPSTVGAFVAQPSYAEPLTLRTPAGPAPVAHRS